MKSLVDELPRLTLGIVFILWGIDKVIDPGKYIAWISVTWRVRMFIPPFLSIESFLWIITVLELVVGALLAIKMLVKYISIVVSILLVFFLLFAGPPMSYPQDIALLGVSIWLYYNHRGESTLTK